MGLGNKSNIYLLKQIELIGSVIYRSEENNYDEIVELRTFLD